MHGVTFLQDLAIVMIVAGLVTVLFHRLKLPVVLGYILAGVIVGPHTTSIPLVVDQETIRTLSQLGIILLLFSLGLEFSLRKLREVGAAALITATLKILLMIWVGYGLGGLFGWKRMDSVFLGAILSISSTTIIVKALDELNKRKEKFTHVIYGILIVEDILAILLIALLSGFATTGSFHAGDVEITLVRLAAFLVAVLVLGLLAVPRFLNYVARFKRNEMLLVSVLGLCFGVSLLAERLGYDVALGAFLIGAIVAEARQIARIEMLMEPVRDMFSAVFFVSIGLMIDPSLLTKYWLPILVITVVTVVGKVIACAFGAFVAGNDRHASARIGMGLVPIGEFSFIIAALGMHLGVTGDFQYPIAVSVSAITTLMTPFLISRSDALVEWADRKSPRTISNYLDLYTRWIGHLKQSQPDNIAWKLVRLWVSQMSLCIVLVTGIFISATFFRERALAWWPNFPRGVNGVKAALWLTATILSLPLLIAVVRKLQALGMLLSEMSVTRSAAGARTEALRAIVAHVILAAGCIGLLQLLLVLSSAILPSSWNVVLVLALIVAAATVLLRRSFIRLYASAQIALRETFAQPPPPRDHGIDHALMPVLRHAEIASVAIEPRSPAAGRLIRELNLRAKTGASIVGIERAGESLVNPEPDEELRAGDLVLLLGSPAQLKAARALLGGGEGE